MLRRASCRRVAYAASIALLLALNLACPGPPPGPPEVAECDGAPADAAIDGVQASATFETGGQGLRMIAVRVEWLGEAAPECATADITVRDEDGATINERSVSLETEPSEGGRRSTSAVYFILDAAPCFATAEVRAYGQTSVATAVSSLSFCADAGAPDAGTADAGEPGAAVPDAAVPDGG